MASRWRVMRATWSAFAASPSVRGLYDAVASTAGAMLGAGYQALDPRRKTGIPRGFALRSASANELATMSVAQLRALCRKLERDNPTARAAIEGLVAQVVGTGIALEPDHGDEAINDRIRTVWQAYLHGCDISGRRTIYDLQSQAFRDVVTAGEFLWRMPVLTERAERGLVPVAVLPLECEWIATEVPPQAGDAITAVAGIELDRWGRPVAYWLVNPEAAMTRSPERVPASEVIHDFERRRSLQARGEPWLAPVVERIWQEGDLVDAELRSAINCAAMALVITSENHGAVDDGSDGLSDATADDPAQRIAVGSVARVFPGEDVKAFSHNRPAQQIADFRRSLRGDIAAACRVAQNWLDRDYSRANYSSMRAAMLDNERLLQPVREWFGHATIGALYQRVLPYLCLMAGVPMPKRATYRLVPDGQPYVDPLKDRQAAILGIVSGLTSWEREVGRTGDDARKLHEQLEKELTNPLLASIFAANLHASAPAAPVEDPAPQGDGESGDTIKPGKATTNAAA